MLRAAMLCDDGLMLYVTQDARPTVGLVMCVGAPNSEDQYWCKRKKPMTRITSRVTRIVYEAPSRVVFETTNSTYTWTCEEIHEA